MKKISLLIVAFALLIWALTSCGTGNGGGGDQGNASGGGSTKLVVGHTGTEGNSVYVFFHELKEEVEKRSDGQIVLEVHDAGSLGGDQELVEGLRSGTVDMASAASSNMVPFAPDVLVLDLPYVFKSREGAHNALDGEVGQQLLDQISSSANTKALAFIDVGGFRLVANTKREVKVPADIVGLKLRTTSSETEVALTEAWGANATPVNWAETYTSVEQGVVDGLQLQPVWLALNGFGEVVKYATRAEALMAFHAVQMNKQQWQSLSPEQQEIITKSVEAARKTANKADKEGEDKYIKRLKDAEVEIYDPTDAEMNEWREPGRNTWSQFTDQIDQSVLDKIVSAQQ